MTRPRVPTGVVGEELRLEIVDGKLCLTAWRHSFVSGRYERIASLPPVALPYAGLLVEAIEAATEWDAVIVAGFDDAIAAIKAGAR